MLTITQLHQSSARTINTKPENSYWMLINRASKSINPFLTDVLKIFTHFDKHTYSMQKNTPLNFK